MSRKKKKLKFFSIFEDFTNLLNLSSINKTVLLKK